MDAVGIVGGGGGIRTLGAPRVRSPGYQPGSISRSDTPPSPPRPSRDTRYIPGDILSRGIARRMMISSAARGTPRTPRDDLNAAGISCGVRIFGLPDPGRLRRFIREIAQPVADGLSPAAFSKARRSAGGEAQLEALRWRPCSRAAAAPVPCASSAMVGGVSVMAGRLPRFRPYMITLPSSGTRARVRTRSTRAGR
jgi:hypothetical protein